MSDLLDYRLDGAVAVLTIDDGKANALSHDVLAAVGGGLDRAEGEARAVVLAGRPGRFSAGFDLSVMTSGIDPMRALVQAGAELALRVFTFPMPTVAACTGHALAMGAILLLAFDHRVGAAGPFKLGMNEVAIGMSVPHFAVELGRYRLASAHLDEVLFGTTYDPGTATSVGYLDEVVAADDVVPTALAKATALAELRTGAVRVTKDMLRADLAATITARLPADLADLQPAGP